MCSAATLCGAPPNTLCHSGRARDQDSCKYKMAVITALQRQVAHAKRLCGWPSISVAHRHSGAPANRTTAHAILLISTANANHMCLLATRMPDCQHNAQIEQQQCGQMADHSLITSRNAP